VTWDDFLESGRIQRISPDKKLVVDAQLDKAKQALSSGDAAFFASALPSSEHWRCLGEYGPRAVYLDIETTGLSLSSPITMVGVSDGKRVHTLVRGMNLSTENLRGILAGAGAIVTFNGASFDLPIIERQFPGAIPAVPQVDLRYPLRRLGHTGGLKAIERELGIERDKRVEYMTGQEAVYLWRIWERQGSRNALDLLTEYNAADCLSLVVLARRAYRDLRRATLVSAAGPGKVEY
jgi:uncharacterized protein YprB with RNaseH-like and TPR domain